MPERGLVRGLRCRHVGFRECLWSCSSAWARAVSRREFPVALLRDTLVMSCSQSSPAARASWPWPRGRGLVGGVFGRRSVRCAVRAGWRAAAGSISPTAVSIPTLAGQVRWSDRGVRACPAIEGAVDLPRGEGVFGRGLGVSLWLGGCAGLRSDSSSCWAGWLG
jgi:hypothetical protein